MTGRDLQRARAQSEADDDVAQYLRESPDFLVRHPGLLNVMHIPHDCGGAASLIEAQVASLKRECQDLSRRLDGLVGNARSNEDLARRLHRLILALLESTSLDEIFTTLYQGLEEGFGADHVSLRLFAAARDAGDRGLAEVAGSSGDAALFAELFAGGQPVCGAVESEQGAYLFGERRDRVASAALLPLSLGQRFGVLAIGATEAQRFHPSMGTLYLRQLGEVLGRLIARHVA